MQVNYNNESYLLLSLLAIGQITKLFENLITDTEKFSYELLNILTAKIDDEVVFLGDTENTSNQNEADCPGGDCSVSLPENYSQTQESSGKSSESSEEKRVDNPDGTYNIIKTNSSGVVVNTKYSADGKKLSATSTNKDGSKTTYSYKYNEDGSYTETAKNKKTGASKTTKYDADDRRISATSKSKNGEKKKYTYKYNDDGSYSVVITYSTTKSGYNGYQNYSLTTNYETTKKYDKNGKILSSVTKKTDNNGKTKTQSTVYKYNNDGSYTKTLKRYNGSKKVTTVDANGNIDKSKSTIEVENANAKDYKSKIASKGTTWVIFTNPVSCGHCDHVENALPHVLSKIDNKKVSSILQINLKENDGSLHGKKIDENMDLMYSFLSKFNVSECQYPIAVKFVDGEAVDIKPNLDSGDNIVSNLVKIFNS